MSEYISKHDNFNLSITEKLFDELYGTKVEKDIFIRKPENDIDMEENFLTSKLWRLNNIYSIIDKWGNTIPFVMNESQHRVYSITLEHPRVIILKSRQQGISTLWLVSYFDDAIFNETWNIGLMAQGLDESSTLLERVKCAWDSLDPSVKDLLRLNTTKDNAKSFSFTNDSNIFIRTSFRSATLQRLHISEFGKIANRSPTKAKETKTGTLQTIAAGNTVVVESTAEGKNMFSQMWNEAVSYKGKRGPKDFYPIFLSWIIDPDCRTDIEQDIMPAHAKYFEELEEELDIVLTQEQKWFWVMQYRELGDDIYQEYPSTPEEAFLASRDGTYYAKQYIINVVKKKRIYNNLYDPNLDTYVAVDLGMNDDFVVSWFQLFHDQIRIVAEYVNSGQGIEHYVNYINDKGWPIEDLILPHDAEVRELGTGTSRKDRFYELGCTRLTVLTKAKVNDGIEIVRKYMKYIYIDASCTYLQDCFMNYSKEWDDKRETWKDEPLHDEYSHGADNIRYVCSYINLYLRFIPKENVIRKPRNSIGNSGSSVVDGMAF